MGLTDRQIKEIVTELQPFLKISDSHSLKVFKALVTKLRNNESGLKSLKQAVKSRGLDAGDCFTDARNADIRSTIDKVRGFQWLIYAQVVRFGSELVITNKDAVVPLSSCQFPFTLPQSDVICLNPWHLVLNNQHSEEQPQSDSRNCNNDQNDQTTGDNESQPQPQTESHDISDGETLPQGTAQPQTEVETPTETDFRDNSDHQTNNQSGSENQTFDIIQVFDPDNIHLWWVVGFQLGCPLTNLGNSCFLNALLQCLSHIASLFQYLVTFHKRNQCKTKPGEFCPYCLLFDHINFAIWSTQPIAPRPFYDQLHKLIPGFVQYTQNDCQELLVGILSTMQTASMSAYTARELPLVDEMSTPVSLTFGGVGTEQLTCELCSFTTDNFASYMSVSIPVKTPTLPTTTRWSVSLEDCVRVLIETEQIERLCTCGHEKSFRKWTATQLPNVMIFHLQLFLYERQGTVVRTFRVNGDVLIPQQIDLSFLSNDNNGDSQWFELISVVRHNGKTAKEGHYTAGVKDPVSNNWYLFNDSSVSQVDETTILGSNSMEGPYLLFYNRMKKIPTPPESKAQEVPTGDGNGKNQMPDECDSPAYDTGSDSCASAASETSTKEEEFDIDLLVTDFVDQIENHQYSKATETTIGMIKAIGKHTVGDLLKFALDNRLWILELACRQYIKKQKLHKTPKSRKMCGLM